jgi:hypothetical protein
MEIVNKARTYEAMMTRFETFADRVDTLCRANGEKALQGWLDNEDVCRALNLSKRTLQTYRDNGTLPHTRIAHKMYYRPADVERLFVKLKTR